mgnify:CR=1 FL=1
MASVEASKLSKEEHDELCCSYAALMLHDDGLEITVSEDKHWFNGFIYPIGWEIGCCYQGLRKRSRAILANALRQGPQGCWCRSSPLQHRLGRWTSCCRTCCCRWGRWGEGRKEGRSRGCRYGRSLRWWRWLLNNTCSIRGRFNLWFYR